MDITSDWFKGSVLLVSIWFVLGVFSSVWMYFQAQAAVKVRPNLAEVDFITALLTAHGFDWLFYHSPIAGVVAVFVLYGVAFGGMILVGKRRYNI